MNEHTCHWPQCPIEVPPAMWGCKKHWFMLPKSLRDNIWKYYRVGQEVDKNPSKMYLMAADNVQAWIRIYLKRQTIQQNSQASIKINRVTE